MDRIRTLLLARTHTVVMDPDLVAGAATRPARDTDVEKLEAELVQLGFVLSIDLATLLRRLPYAALQETRGWIQSTLAAQVGAHRPHVPLFRTPAATPGDPRTPYLQRVVSWLVTHEVQPCPWCGERKTVHALDPCGHLVCRTCWEAVSYSGCPICHRRVAPGEPFVQPRGGERVTGHGGQLTLIHVGIDLPAMARDRFERLLARPTPLSTDDRREVETVIDDMGPRAVGWLPAAIPVRETRALAIARLWLAAPDRRAMARETQSYLTSASDVLRVACVVMGGNESLAEPMKLRSIPRTMRRAVLEALDRLPLAEVEDDIVRHVGLWKRVGERLHPGELATELPTAARAFAIVRGNVPRPARWAAPVEAALRAGNPRSALARLTHRPGELLRRADHLVRLAQATQLDALQTIVKAIEIAAPRGTPTTLLTLASHVTRRGRPWRRRVFFPKGEVLRAWTMPDTRPPLRADAIGAMVTSLRRELVARAEQRRHFPRAVIDRALVDVPVPFGARAAATTKVAWPRGSELPLPAAHTLRLVLHREEPPNTRVDLHFAIVMFDAAWRHVATRDAIDHVDLPLEPLHVSGARHVVMVVFSNSSVPLERLPLAFAGLAVAPAEGEPFDPRAVALRFDLRGSSAITVPLAIDLDERSLRWLDVHVRDHDELRRAGGAHAALAHVGRDFAALADTHARPTLWDVACIHAAARANIVYVRERDGGFTAYRRRDGESALARLGRLLSGVNHDGLLASLPTTPAPTWFAVLSPAAVPRGSIGFQLDTRAPPADGITRLSAGDLIAELGPRR